MVVASASGGGGMLHGEAGRGCNILDTFVISREWEWEGKGEWKSNNHLKCFTVIRLRFAYDCSRPLSVLDLMRLLPYFYLLS